MSTARSSSSTFVLEGRGVTGSFAAAAVRVRMNRAFRVLRAREADPRVLARLGQKGLDADYGLVFPAVPGATIRLVTPALASLLESLRRGPRDLQMDLIGTAGDALILDGIIERWTGQGWESGPSAATGDQEAEIDVADTGIQAIVEARARTDLSAPALAAFLYQFGKKPYSARWLREVGGPAASDLAAWYGLSGAQNIEAVTSRWAGSRTAEWWTWRSPNLSAADGPSWKLYVNVEPRWLPKALSHVAEILDSEDATAFKVAGNLRAALRPDKLVIYFARRDAMLRAGALIAKGLSRSAPHPLAFSARLGVLPCVTWGVDPPRQHRMMSGSWRLWVCSRLAGILWGMLAIPTGREFWRHLKARLLAEGVELSTWSPTSSLLEAWGVPLEPGRDDPKPS